MIFLAPTYTMAIISGGDDMDKDKVILDGKPYAILSYLWILCLVPLILKKDNKFALFHARQGLVIFIGEIAIGIVGVIPVFGWLALFFGTIIFGVVSLVGIVQALRGEYWRAPFICDIAEKIRF